MFCVKKKTTRKVSNGMVSGCALVIHDKELSITELIDISDYVVIQCLRLSITKRNEFCAIVSWPLKRAVHVVLY